MLTLYQLAISHYNEKVRWALDLKGVENRRVTLIPGLHRITVRRFGTTTTPVVRGDGRVVTESTAILQYLEELSPHPPLFSDDPTEAQQLSELIDYLDRVAGTAVRAYAYWLILQEPGGLYARWAVGLSARQRLVLRPMMPMMRRVLPRAFGLSAKRAPGHLARVWESCQRVESTLDINGDGYLVGGRFTAADLTAASLLGPAVAPPGSPWDPAVSGTAPGPELLAFQEQFRKRPAAAWITNIWARHRLPAAP